MTPAENIQTLRLDSILDFRASMPLRDAFLDRRGDALMVDASQVTQIGGLCLQVLIAARRAWRSDCIEFAITGRSEAFDSAITLFGAAEELGLQSQREQ